MVDSPYRGPPFLAEAADTTFYFFNPFPATTFSKVVSNILHSVDQIVRPVDIVLHYPIWARPATRANSQQLLEKQQVQLLVDKIPSVLDSYATSLDATMTPRKEKGSVIMKIADRIQRLRKMKGISQEELAEKMGVSRQAVSKWESEQSIPDLDKIIVMSEYFEVTTDYILKGVETPSQKRDNKSFGVGQTLYIASTAFLAIGLLCAFGGWYAEQISGEYLGIDDNSSNWCGSLLYWQHLLAYKGTFHH